MREGQECVFCRGINYDAYTSVLQYIYIHTPYRRHMHLYSGTSYVNTLGNYVEIMF